MISKFTIQTLFNGIVDLMKSLPEGDEIRFREPILSKATPHTEPTKIYAVSLGPNDRIAIQDETGEWQEVTVEDQNAELIIPSLYQRLKHL